MKKLNNKLWNYKAILIFTILFLAPNLFAQKKKEDIKSKEYIEAENFFQQLRNDKTIYFGIGISKIRKDSIQKAIRLAKKEAMNELSGSIKSRVMRVLTINLDDTRKQKSNGKWSEEIVEKMKSFSVSHTDEILVNVTTSKPYIDYPKKGLVQVACYINKANYKKFIEDGINKKKKIIRDFITNGNNRFSSGKYISALNNWLQAYNYLNQFFNDLPISDKIDSSGIEKNVGVYLYNQISIFFENLKLASLSSDLLFDVNGNINHRPEILVQYRDEEGVLHNVGKLPLIVQFIEGSGRIPQKIITGINGRASVNIYKIDPFYKRAVIRISVDTADYSRLKEFANLKLPFVDLTFNKMKTVALSVSYNINGKIVIPPNLFNDIQSNLLQNGFQVVETKITNKKPTKKDFNNVNKTFSDYLVFVYINSGKASTIGEYKNLFVSSSNAAVFLYALPNNNLVSSKQLHTVQGYGTTMSDAGWDGFYHLSPKILNTVNIILDNIK